MVELPFLPFCALLGALGVVCVAFVSAWCQQWRGGFAWDGSAQMFNWHPVLMVTGMVVLYGAVALVYRLPLSWSGPKLPWKVLHSALALVAFGLTVLGLVAVFNFHNARGTPNMYSLHSWLGLATVLLFSCQWLAGFTSFLLPWAPAWLRALYKPVHVFFGSTILMLAMASCVSGINEKLFFSLPCSALSADTVLPRLPAPSSPLPSLLCSPCWPHSRPIAFPSPEAPTACAGAAWPSCPWEEGGQLPRGRDVAVQGGPHQQDRPGPHPLPPLWTGLSLLPASGTAPRLCRVRSTVTGMEPAAA
ncbi:lysosomal membrane ascorbate-dependent ferrireductase CYB561A3 isoform X2 [Struthio camelus]